MVFLIVMDLANWPCFCLIAIIVGIVVIGLIISLIIAGKTMLTKREIDISFF